MRVLVVEDFEVLARSIGTGLRREGMAVDVVLNGNDALGHLAITRYDVVVLDRVGGLGLGADDYLSKPFDFAELVARIRALGRRATPAAPPMLEAGGLV